MSTEINISGGIALIVQIALLVLHYGNSSALGIQWNSLPWWIVWFPILLSVVVIMIVFVALIIAAILS